MNRQATASPLVALVIGLGLVLAGWYVLSNSTGGTAQLGWVLVAVGIIAFVGNAVLLWVQRRDLR